MPEIDNVTPQDTIGTTGDTGHATGIYLHLAFYDEQGSSFENPLSILPPVADRERPVIRRVLLSVGDTLLPIPTASPVAAGRYQILAEVYDPRQDVAYNWPMAPYSIHVGLDGKEMRAIVFDSLRVKDGRAVLGETDLGLDGVYRSDGLVELGTADLRAGESRLDIDVRDYAGNEAAFETRHHDPIGGGPMPKTYSSVPAGERSESVPCPACGAGDPPVFLACGLRLRALRSLLPGLPEPQARIRRSSQAVRRPTTSPTSSRTSATSSPS